MTQPPRTIVYASVALIVSGVGGVITSLLALTASTRQWLFDITKKADAKSSDVKSGKTKMPSDASIHHSINSSGTQVVIISVLVLLLLGYIAFSLFKGKHWARWAVVGAFVILTLITGSPGGGLSGLLGVTSDAPAAFKLFAFASSLAMLVAVVMVNLRPSVAFLALSRPMRKARASGGLFGPRPPAGPRNQPATAAKAAKTRPAQRTPTKPAATRPADPKPRAKARIDVTAPDAKARARGKSRRTNVDDRTN